LNLPTNDKKRLTKTEDREKKKTLEKGYSHRLSPLFNFFKKEEKGKAKK